MSKELELFKELFAPYSNISILHINNSLNLVTKTLENIKDENGGTIKYIEFKQEKDARLSGVAREYEYVILGDILSHCPNKEKILKLIYKSIENSGNIIILENENNNNKYELLELLEDIGFQAANNIDLFDNYNLLTAKKMHHWDKGL